MVKKLRLRRIMHVVCWLQVGNFIDKIVTFGVGMGIGECP